MIRLVVSVVVVVLFAVSLGLGASPVGAQEDPPTTTETTVTTTTAPAVTTTTVDVVNDSPTTEKDRIEIASLLAIVVGVWAIWGRVGRVRFG